MTQTSQAGWYRDPTLAYDYRYWDGSTWTDQISEGGTGSTDSLALHPGTAATPPPPGTAASSVGSIATVQRIRVTPERSRSTFETVVGSTLLIVVIVVLFALLSDGTGGGETSPTPDSSLTEEAPEPAERP